MSNYTQTTSFTPKDALLSGNPAKLIKGADFDVEFAAIAAAIATKLDSAQAGNPTASIGLAAVNGSASTYMRSDGAPALSQAIAPTWTGAHIFSPTAGTAITVNNVAGSGSAAVFKAHDGNGQITFGPADGAGAYGLGLSVDSTGGKIGTNSNSRDLQLQTNNITGLQITTSQVVQARDAAGNFKDVGWLDAPQNSNGGNYTLVLADRGRSVQFLTTGPFTCTIPANGTTAFPLGSVVVVVNNTSNNLTISSTDTVLLAGTGSSGARTLAVNGIATLYKYTSTGWLVSGAGVS